MEDFNNGLDGNLASRMRKVYAEQFHTLVKMHLSFELDLNTEENDTVTEKAKLKKWGLLNFSKKSKPPLNTQKSTEGALLTKEGINQVKQLIEYLAKEDSIVQEGIFRRTGKLTRQQDLKTALYQGSPLHLDEGKFSVHDCASVLKGYLADLSEPLLTDLHYPEYCQIAELCTSSSSSNNDSRLLRALQLLLLLLPPPNRIVLKQILNLLNKVAEHENSNKMNCDSLATLFTPHLMCPRKLSPEALHMNSQNLSGLVSFMIQKGTKLYEIPPKLSTDIRAFWVEQEKKLLSPQKSDLNESTTDTTGTAHTVFSFVDRNLTAQATASQDTQAALAQLYAHIQSMPESSKKRRLVKQFNKENGQGTPRHVKHNSSGVAAGGSGAGRSFGDSIKKRIFQKKLHKKIVDVKLGCNFSRSSSEENIVLNSLESPTLLPKVFSKSEDELSDLESYDLLSQEQQQLDSDNLLKLKQMSNSTSSLNTPVSYKSKSKVILKSYLSISKDLLRNTPSFTATKDKESSHGSQKINKDEQSSQDMCNKAENNDGVEVAVSNVNSAYCNADKAVVVTVTPAQERLLDPIVSDDSRSSETAALLLSPATKNRLRYLFAAHTSTPSNFITRSLNAVNDYGFTPITADEERSMSPITQSATKMTKAMQETMMTPRCRKPVMVSASTTNLCNLPTLNNGSIQYDSTNSLQSNLDLPAQKTYVSHPKESTVTDTPRFSHTVADKENIEKIQGTPEEQQTFVTCVEYDPNSTTKCTTTSTNPNAFKEYYLSRSLLSASPVDLSFTSRTGDFEQSGSDLNVMAEGATTPGSDTSGIASGSTNSMNNSGDKTEKVPSPRKRCTSLDRSDCKRPMEDESQRSTWLRQSASIDKSTLTSMKDSLSETSF
ncbi:uncharacterized protein LOC106638987 [Copidosoma floridanum]|uniref:uncharacterized protein LOC106638987 n=1 Tax=Copidosoma floridanum TaxID=29053 RepID=UPI0006C9B406|nr:uncharacterized protein LOC106638987 [Copidosoma floridanum]